MKRLIFLLVMGGALFAAYHASNPPLAGADTAEATVVSLATSTSAGEKLSARMGRLGARLAGPFVRSMSRDTERLLQDLTPLIAKAKPGDAKRARDMSVKILARDSAAHVELQNGRPVAALKLVFDARGLIPAVRQYVAEERAFQ